MLYFGEISALLAALMWSTSSFVFAAASVRIGAIQLNISRMIIGAAMIGVVLPVFGLDLHVSTNQLLLLSLSGLVGLVIGDSFLFQALKEIGPRITMLVMSSYPAFAAVMAYFILGESISMYGILGITVTMIGISIVIMGNKKDGGSKFKITRRGLFFSFIGAAGQATGLIIAKIAFNESDIHALSATFIRLVAAVVILLPLAALKGKFKNPIKVFTQDKRVFRYVMLASFIGPVLGIAFSFWAIQNTKIAIASTLMATVPIIMLPMSRIIHKEKLTLASVSGAFVAVFGVYMLFW